MAGALDMFKKKGGGGGEQEQAKEDPIAKAEREFFEIIKKVARTLTTKTFIIKPNQDKSN